MKVSFLSLRLSTQACAVLLVACLGPAPLRPASPELPSGCQKISFKELAGWRVTDAVYKAKPGRVLGFVPRPLRQLDGQEVAVTGFMLPVKIHNRLVTEFLLLRTQNTCCFGIPPELNEVVEVLKVIPPTKVLMDTPITVVGKMHVKERWDGTFLCSIYQMEAEGVAAE